MVLALGYGSERGEGRQTAQQESLWLCRALQWEEASSFFEQVDGVCGTELRTGRWREEEEYVGIEQYWKELTLTAPFPFSGRQVKMEFSPL